PGSGPVWQSTASETLRSSRQASSGYARHRAPTPLAGRFASDTVQAVAAHLVGGLICEHRLRELARVELAFAEPVDLQLARQIVQHCFRVISGVAAHRQALAVPDVGLIDVGDDLPRLRPVGHVLLPSSVLSVDKSSTPAHTGGVRE